MYLASEHWRCVALRTTPLRTILRALLSVIATIALLSTACGSQDEPADTEPTTTTSSTAAPTESTVTVYFSVGDGSDCGEVSPFVRTHNSDSDNNPLGAALEQLIAGPTDKEIAAGASSFFSSETATSLDVIDQWTPGLLVVGFDDLRPLIPNASTSCGSEALLAQLNSTVLQYAPRVRYDMLNSCETFSDWLQIECMEYTRDGAEPATLTTEQQAAGSGCFELIYGVLDGQWFGYIDSVSAYDVEFDIACWFTGDAAVAAASEDGEESPPPDGYYVRNDGEVLVTPKVNPATPVTWFPDIGDPSTEATVSFAEWTSLRDSRPDQPGVWLTVENEQIVEIIEQYVP